ncbi:MAG TPA: hypothetical protein VFN48_07920, partial [Solirubrobacteraceae bacterium]|nr:hypothetical protein [Solirubrobacteraceae bacterium]
MSVEDSLLVGQDMVTITAETRELDRSSEQEIAALDARARRRRKIKVWVLRVVVFVVIVGGWQLLADNTFIIDPFYWGKPSGIVT